MRDIMNKKICSVCGKRENEKAMIDCICASCWNKKSKLVRIK